MTSAKRPRRIPGQTILCGWCGSPIAVRTTGRVPKWCSAVCRHRAWSSAGPWPPDARFRWLTA